MHPHLPEILTRLEAVYGKQTRFSSKSALDQLIATILSQRTTYADEKAAYDKLLATYGDWTGVAAAPVAGIEACIQTSNYPEVKAPRIKEVLTTIIERHGSPTLDFLADWPVPEAMEYLMALPGVGHKTTTFVLLFSLRKPVIPVDTHVHRTNQRIGILGPKVTQAKAHQILLELLPADADYLLNYHKLFFKLGQKICRYRHPSCERCPVKEFCAYYTEIKQREAR